MDGKFPLHKAYHLLPIFVVGSPLWTTQYEVPKDCPDEDDSSMYYVQAYTKGVLACVFKNVCHRIVNFL